MRRSIRCPDLQTCLGKLIWWGTFADEPYGVPEARVSQGLKLCGSTVLVEMF